MINRRRFLFTLILNQVSGVMLSLLMLFINGSFNYFNINIILSLIFTNSIGFSFLFLFSIYSYIIKDKIEIKSYRVIIYVIVGIISLFLGIQLASNLSKYLLSFSVISFDKNTLFVFLITNGLLGSISIFLIYIYKKLKTQIEKKVQENEKLKHLQLQAELAALQSKINPHFLFNTLNTILDLVYDDPKKVEDVVLNLSSIYRKILYSPTDKFVSLENELSLVKQYLEIEKIRMGKRLSYIFEIDDESKNIEIPPLIIEPIVENAVIHGINPKIEGGTVTVTVKNNSGLVSVEVSDDGIGVENENFKLGFGMRSVKERIQIIFGEDSTFKIIKNNKGGVTVRITFKNRSGEKI